MIAHHTTLYTLIVLFAVQPRLICRENQGDKRFVDSVEIVIKSAKKTISRDAAPWARSTKNVKNLRDKCVGHVEKLDLRFLQNKTQTFLVSATHLILRFTIYKKSFNKQTKL